MKYKVIVGIDQSKLTIDAALLLTDSPQKLLTEQFENNTKGLKNMIRWIEKYSLRCNTEDVLICTEHTGIYSYPLCLFCQENRLALWMENPLQIKQSLGIHRGKNDRTDAKRIAQYALTNVHKEKLYIMPAKALIALKQLLSYRERLVKSKKGFQTAQGELKELNADLSGLIIRDTDSLLKVMDRKIEKVNATMLHLIKTDATLNELYHLIITVPGIGDITAFYLLVYTGGFSQFENWKQFACYCGIAPFDHQSGTSIKRNNRVSHLANKKLKSILTLCAIRMINGDIRA